MYDTLASNGESFNAYESTGKDLLFTWMTEAEFDCILVIKTANRGPVIAPEQISSSLSTITVTKHKKRGRTFLKVSKKLKK